MKNQTTVTFSCPGIASRYPQIIGLLLLLSIFSCGKNEITEPITAPAVVSMSPAAAANGQPFETVVKIVFNMAMDSASINTAFILSRGSEVVTGQLKYEGAAIEFIPASDLQPHTTYTVRIGKSARSLSGVSLPEEFSYTFTVKGPDQYAMVRTSEKVTDFSRDGSRMMQVGNYMYSFGGWANPPEASYNDVYRSADLVNWEKRPDAPWHGRHVFGIAQLGNACFIIGGDNLQSQFDVWKTTDGENWTQLANNILGNRIYYGCTAHEGYLYIVGGANYSDVWRSADGITWTKVADQLSFLNGENFAGSLASFNGKLWLVGGGGTGGGDGTPRKSVWSSRDGISWQQENDFPGSQRYYTDLCVWDNKLWVIGGYNYEEGNIKSIWYMNRQGQWTEFNTPADYIGRHATGVGVFNNRLVISCGNYHNDSWVIDKIN